MNRVSRTLAGVFATLAIIAGAVTAIAVPMSSDAPKPAPAATAIWGS